MFVFYEFDRQPTGDDIADPAATCVGRVLAASWSAAAELTSAREGGAAECWLMDRHQWHHVVFNGGAPHFHFGGWRL